MIFGHAREATVPSSLMIGDTQTHEHYAFLPYQIDDGRWVWLGRVKITWTFCAMWRWEVTGRAIADAAGRRTT